ncbi:MAG TPA: S8 family serine peptidase [Isosphaeraceae bacterium]|nr:S8 family serine peptidase [Isosphaeraceae bacterium]
MGWTRKLGRDDRGRRRPRIETLEQRALLTAAPALSTTTPPLVGPFTAGDTPPSNAVDFSTIIGATAARAKYGVTGAGQAVAVIDTGVDYNNVDLGAGFGPGHKVVAGYDFADSSPNPIAVDQHGTAVAGLIAGSDPADPGIAPGANIVALRVFDSSGNSSFNDVANALQWVITNHAQYNITVVNMSISDGNNYTSNWFAQDGGVGQEITGLIAQLDTLNIPVVAAAGNNYSGQQGMGFTAIVPQTISVTSTDGSADLVSNAQRLGASLGGASATDIAAPGQGVYAPAGDGTTFSLVGGTSFAAPIVSGSIVLLQQIYEQRFGKLPTVDQLDSWIQGGSDPVHDGTSVSTVGQIDILKAAALIPTPATNPPPPAPTSPPPVPPPPPPPPPSPPPPPPTVQTEVYLNGQDLGSVTSSQLDGGWSAFLSLFTGGVTSIQTWNAGGSTTASPIPIKGATITSIQEWTPATASNVAPPQTAGTILPAATTESASTPAPVVKIAARHVAHPAAAHHMARAWDAGFAGHRRHR